MDLGLTGPELNYIPAAFIILLGIILAFLARRTVRRLESEAGETSMYWDDIILAAIGMPVQDAIMVFSVYFAVTWFGILLESM